jgi:predicted DNA repair protein MutK
MDDVGLKLSQRESGFELTFGHLLLQSMPKLLTLLSVVGTIAMLWVGGGIILHGTHEIGWHLVYDIAHGLEVWVAGISGAAGSIMGWLAYAAFSAVLGLILGAGIVGLLHKVFKFGQSAEAH